MNSPLQPRPATARSAYQCVSVNNQKRKDLASQKKCLRETVVAVVVSVVSVVVAVQKPLKNGILYLTTHGERVFHVRFSNIKELLLKHSHRYRHRGNTKFGFDVHHKPSRAISIITQRTSKPRWFFNDCLCLAHTICFSALLPQRYCGR